VRIRLSAQPATVALGLEDRGHPIVDWSYQLVGEAHRPGLERLRPSRNLYSPLTLAL
jgi:hypothetical protein